MNTKICGRCKRELDTNLFGESSRRPGELKSYCRACDAEYQKERAGSLRGKDRRAYDEAHRQSSRRRLEIAKELGLCLKCKKEKARTGKTACESCARYAIEAQKKLRANRIAAGICERCGKRPPRPDALRCQKC